MDPKDKFHSSLYIDHNEARFIHFRTLGLPVEGKSILELGAGIGDHTAFLLSSGAREVLSLEARDENISLLNDRYGESENVSILKMDLDNPFSLERKFDVVYSYGLLYHLCEPESLLQWIADHVSGYLIMETCVSVSIKDEIIYVDEDDANVTQSFSGTGCRPSRKWIMNRLGNIFPYCYVPVTQPDHPEFPVNWENIDVKGSLVRSIFVGSNVNFDDNVMLTKEMPLKYEAV